MNEEKGEEKAKEVEPEPSKRRNESIAEKKGKDPLNQTSKSIKSNKSNVSNKSHVSNKSKQMAPQGGPEAKEEPEKNEFIGEEDLSKKLNEQESLFSKKEYEGLSDLEILKKELKQKQELVNRLIKDLDDKSEALKLTVKMVEFLNNKSNSRGLK